MITAMKKNEIETAFDEAVKFGEVYLRTLDEYIRLKVYELAQKRRMIRAEFVCRLMEANQNYPYPEEYPLNRQFEYWEDHDLASRNAIGVIRAIEQIKVKIPKKREERLTIKGIDIPALVSDLENRKFFDSDYKEDILKWFNGTPPQAPVLMNISANLFISVIADLCDARPKFIINTKEFCYNYIHNSFLFNGERAEPSYIKKVMKPDSVNRIFSRFNKKIPDILTFKTK